MNLYKIMLVDDEEEVRLSIIKKIDWHSVGFHVVGDAENGEDALEKIELLEPDVIITDIRMPYMDGLKLTEKIHQKFPFIKVIIFSGFDDFEYAKEAIRQGVIEYILKPVNSEEMTAILKRVKESLDKEIESKRNIDLLKQNYVASLPVLREQFLNNLLRKNIKKADIENKLREYNIDIADAAFYQTVAIDIETDKQEYTGKFSQLKELIPISIKGLIEERFQDIFRVVIFTSLQDFRLSILIAVDDKNKNQDTLDVLRDICKEVQRILGVSITMGVGNRVDALKDIGSSYKAALNALGYKMIVGRGEAIYINDVEPMALGVLQFDEIEQNNLVSVIKFGSSERIHEIVDSIISKMEEARVHSRQYQAYMLSIVNAVVQMMQQYEISLNNLNGDSLEYLNIMECTKDIDSFKTWLIDIAFRMNESIRQKRESNSKQIIKEAKAYIQNNYQNPELSVEMICNHLHMSTAYFSTLFKKEVGQTYIAYLTDIRLNKAIDLLNTTSDKTYIIAEKIGYTEQNYFSYVFKKKFGISPTKYRGNK